MLKYRFENLAVNQLLPNPLRPRFKIDQKELMKLADSIRQYGVLSPILVAQNAAGLQIIAGERRWRAARIAGLTEIPAMICEASTVELILLFLEENLNRSPVNLLEQANALKRLIERGQFTMKAITKRLKVEEEELNTVLACDELPEKVKIQYLNGKMSNEELINATKEDPILVIHKTKSR